MTGTAMTGTRFFALAALLAAPAIVTGCDPARAPPATALVFTTQPQDGQAGVAFIPAIQVAITDRAGQVIPDATMRVTLALNDNPGGGELGGTLTRHAVNGVATFPDLTLTRVATGYTLKATATGLSGAVSNAFSIAPGPPAELTFTRAPGGTGSGAVMAPVTVSLVDAFGNPTTAAASIAIGIGSGPAGAVLGGTTTATSAAGVATFAEITLDLEGLYTLTATCGSLPVLISPAFTVRPGPPASMAFTMQPTSTRAGTPIAPAVQVTLFDAHGNVSRDATDAVTVDLRSNPGRGTLSGTLTRRVVNGVATFSDLSIDKAAAGYVLRARSGALASVNSSAFNITPGAPARLAFTVQPRSAIAGKAIAPPVRVAILDAFGNQTASTALVAVVIAHNPGGSTLSGTLIRPAIAGIATFNDLSLNKAGTGYLLGAVSPGIGFAISASFDITPSAPAQLSFRVPPSSAEAGAAISPAVEVEVLDAFGNRTRSTATVTVALRSNPSGGTLAGRVSVSAVAGLATFADLSINKAGLGYTLSAAVARLPTISSTPFDIRPGPAAALVYRQQPTSAAAGAILSPAVQVAIVDAFGNQTGGGATVTLSIASGPRGAPLGGTTSRTAVAGLATFDDLFLTTASAYTLSASSGALPAVTSASFTISPAAASKLAFTVQPTNAQAGAVIAPAVQVSLQDAFGNLTGSTANVTVALGNNLPGGTLGGTTTVAAVAGIATFSSLSINRPATGYTLRASSAGLTSATSNAFDITIAIAGLSYTDPPAGGKIRLVRNGASTATTVVLDLVASAPLTGFYVGFNLPLDTTRVQANPTLQTPGTALPAGSAPIAAKAVLPATGPLANVLVSGQSQKAAGAGAVPGNSVVPAGAVFYTLRLDLKAGASSGVVFDGAALGPRFAGKMRDRAGTDVAVSADFRIGRLVVN